VSRGKAVARPTKLSGLVWGLDGNPPFLGMISILRGGNVVPSWLGVFAGNGLDTLGVGEGG
jgi:hypothetical protein